MFVFERLARSDLESQRIEAAFYAVLQAQAGAPAFDAYSEAALGQLNASVPAAA